MAEQREPEQFCEVYQSVSGAVTFVETDQRWITSDPSDLMEVQQ